ncbi:MAG: CHASE2 domain-containing protein [Prochloraceae cyanobacterium]|nr:CHASE2 domain-containing protein [Prochloraceae cyanobacterium]
MRSHRKKQWQEKISLWSVGWLPGLIIIMTVIVGRLTGQLQSLEWFAFDRFLKLRSPEAIDERILIIGIDENDISQAPSYPLPDEKIAEIITKLQKYNPRAIGLDLVRDRPVEPGNKELATVFKNNKKIVGIEKVMPDRFSAPLALAPEQIGFSDVTIDADGSLRRMFLVISNSGEYKFSLSLRLAEAYLSVEGITLENGIRDPYAVRFGNVELPRFFPNSGGYVGADDGGVQILLNFRSGSRPFRTISLNDFETGNFDPNWARDRVVLVGMTAPSVGDVFSSSAIDDTNAGSGLIYGVEVHAHAVSQILSAIEDNRPLLRSWWEVWDYLWIVGWGVLGIILGRIFKSPIKNLSIVFVSSITLVGVSYLLLGWGWWIPVVPALLVFVVNALVLFGFYQYDLALRSRISIQRSTIERTFEDIHNGPLQTLKSLIRDVRDGDLPTEQLLSRLNTVDTDLRKVYKFLEQETVSFEDSILLGEGVKLDLNLPLHELLYQVYRHTLERNFPCFRTLKVTIPKFDPIDYPNLKTEDKRGLCRFLEEALCNAGKYATGLTRLKVFLIQEGQWCVLRIEDNGRGGSFSFEGQGTKQSKKLSLKLGGKFKRSPLSPRGTVCELTWPMQKSFSFSLLSKFWPLVKSKK